MASLFLSIAALALLNAGRLAIGRTVRVLSQRIVKGARKVRCTFSA